MIKIKDITEQLEINLDIICDTCPFANEGSASISQVKTWSRSKDKIVETVKDGITGMQFETARANYDAGIDKGMALAAAKPTHSFELP